MNREEIIKMAREAGMPEWLQEDWFADPFDSFALKFANLVAAAEREACAKFIEDHDPSDHLAATIAAVIRSRGQ